MILQISLSSVFPFNYFSIFSPKAVLELSVHPINSIMKFPIIWLFTYQSVPLHWAMQGSGYPSSHWLIMNSVICMTLSCINMYFTIGSASLARSIRIRFHFRHRTGRIRSVSDHRAGRVWRSRHRSKTPNCLPGARDQVPVLFRNTIERRGASVDSTAARRSHKVHLICCDAWPTRYHYGTDDCMNMITRMTMHYFKCNRMEMTIYFHTHT